MALKIYPKLLALLFLIIAVISCNDDSINPEYKESYILNIAPFSLHFSASGESLPFVITASKTTAEVIEGDTIETEIRSAPYSVSISGVGFSLKNDNVYAEPNTGKEREGILKVVIDGTDVEQNIRLTQDGSQEEDINENEDELEPDTKISNVKILAIGNSFSDDALEHYLHGLAHANGDTIIIGNLYIGGSSLENHYDNSVKNGSYSYRKIVNGQKTTTANHSLLKAIQEESWDYISLQQVSSLSGVYNSYFPYIISLIDYVKKYSTNTKMKIVLHATWAYAQNSTHAGFSNYGNNQETMYNAIIDATKRVAKDVEIEIVIPAGTAIQNARTSSLGDTFCRDGYHLEVNYGRYTAACAWYEKIFKKPVIGNAYVPNNITNFQAEVAQQAAHYAIEKPHGVTSLAYLIDETPIIPFTKKINISFAGNPDDSRWNALANDSKIDNLMDFERGTTNVSVEIVRRFGGVNANGPVTTNTEMDMPSGVSTQSLFGNVEHFSSGVFPTAKILFSSLDPDQLYTFSIFAGRTGANDNREAYYQFSGLNQSNTTIYLNASNNTSNIVKAFNIKPDKNGNIELEVGPGNNNNNPTGFYYLTALSIEPSI